METNTEISEADVKAMKALERKKSLEVVRENKSLRGNKGAAKSKGIIARWFHLQGPEEPPTRVLMMEVRRPAKPKNDLEKMYNAVTKDLRKRMKRISDAKARGDEVIPEGPTVVS